ncbi:hypothetical protein H4582DRAFT_470019 [Lactarius indigo]|nr:hypothetical protein H4582DRAFT_470019 [Lactarius indigo]
MATNAGGAQQCCAPLTYEGLDEDDVYLNFLQQVTHYPDDYYHEPPAAVNALSLSRIQDNLPLSCVDDASLSDVAEFSLGGGGLVLGLSHYHQDLTEEAFFTEGPSPPLPPLKSFCDDRDLLLTMAELGSSPEFPPYPYDEYASSWNSPQPPIDQNCQLFHPPILQGSPQSPIANLTSESCHTSGLSPPPNLDIFPRSPISEKAYHEAMGACNSGLIRFDMAAIQGSPMDSGAARPATVYTDEQAGERLTYPATSCQALWGYVDGFAGISTNDHGSSLPYSLHRNVEAASPSSQSALQVGSPVIVASSVASSQVSPVDEISGTFWCPICSISFSQRQGLNRHNRDKHTPRNICSLCERYEWSSGRRYLFLRHLERYHPEAVLA